jgi:hypothetical protein
MDRPETRFAWNGNVSLAYQICVMGLVKIDPDLGIDRR